MSEESTQPDVYPVSLSTRELEQQRQEALPDELPAGYYLDNFQFLLRFVSERYARLLTAEEKSFAETFAGLDESASKLFVRLLNRKGEYFRVDKLNYDEIPNIDTALDELVGVGLAQRVVPPIEESLKLCLRQELLQHSAISNQAGGLPSKKQDLIDSFLERDVNPLEELDIPVVRQLGEEFIALYRLLFFGNFHQNMTEFVLHELVAPFENYALENESGLFSDRTVIDALIELKVLSELSYELVEQDEEGDLLLALAAKLPERPGEPLLARRYDRIVNRISRQLERLDRPEEALGLYRQSKSAPSRERQARLLVKLDDADTAMLVCESIVEAPENEEELEFAHQFGARLAKKHELQRNVFIVADTSVPTELIEIPWCDDRVESNAVTYFEQSGYDAYYVENSLFRSLFGLYFWDVIYAPVKGAFFHPFQKGPSDLYSPDFFSARQAMIEQRLDDIDDRFAKQITDTLKEKYGTANQFVYWGLFDDRLLNQCFTLIPTAHLKSIFTRMLADLRNNTNGLPDLILFDADGYRLVEIKGPGDKLQKNQTRWFQFFQAEQIPASVVNVEYDR